MHWAEQFRTYMQTPAGDWVGWAWVVALVAVLAGALVLYARSKTPDRLDVGLFTLLFFGSLGYIIGIVLLCLGGLALLLLLLALLL